MHTIIDFSGIEAITKEIAKKYVTPPDVLPIDKGGTGVTTLTELRLAITGTEMPIYNIDNQNIYIKKYIMGEPDETCTGNISIGFEANNNIGPNSVRNIAIGHQALAHVGAGVQDNIAIGHRALDYTKIVGTAIAIGRTANARANTVSNSICIGSDCAYGEDASNLPSFYECIYIGHHSGIRSFGRHDSNVAIGFGSLADSIDTKCNTAVGVRSLWKSSGSTNSYQYCTAIGFNALQGSNLANPLKNATAIGSQATVTGNNQVQLGDSATTVYVYGTVQTRSDERDKANIQDIEYPYKDFIMGLRPVTFQWDLRDDYRVIDDNENYSAELLAEITHDGTHTRHRRHNGFIAQEVKQLMDSLGFDFAGYQDHKQTDGDDVLSLGYEEFIAPLVKVVQDQQAEIQSLKNRFDLLESKI